MPAVAPAILDYAFPLDDNESHARLWILDGEYLIDRDSNYWKLYVLEAVSSWGTIVMLLSIDAVYIGCVNHCIGLNGVLK